MLVPAFVVAAYFSHFTTVQCWYPIVVSAYFSHFTTAYFSHFTTAGFYQQMIAPTPEGLGYQADALGLF
jgi:hypothetical protein